MIDFEKIKSLFGGHLFQSQVDGINTIIEAWKELQPDNNDTRQLAYILGTIFWESAHTMQPVKEHGGEEYLKSKKYYPYFGRDLVQTTWNYNYEKVKGFSGIDVVTHPELIGQMPLAAKVAIHFMIHGWYTGKKLSDYFNGSHQPMWFNARGIINSLDKAEEISTIAQAFYKALS